MNSDKMKFSLVADTVRNGDIDELIGWLKTYPRLSKGPLTLEFESLWAQWLGTKHALFVNSGSSANLLALSSLLAANYIEQDCKIVVPALSWATDLAPVIQLGFTPILCDCNLKDLSIDLDEFERICIEENPQALMLVSVLGMVPDMDRLLSICEKYDIRLIEDTCESFGSEYKKQKLGTLGTVSTFSLYFGHHLSTIEGGIVATNDTRLHNVMASIRSHGWTRDCDASFSKALSDKWNVDEFNAQYAFYYPGYNLRSTDLQAFLGIRQLDYASEVIAIRNKNFARYAANLDGYTWTPAIRPTDFVSNFCYPLICENREKVCLALKSSGIETRPLIAGSMSRQPFYIEKYGDKKVQNSELIHESGLYLPNNHRISPADIDFITAVVKDNLK